MAVSQNLIRSYFIHLYYIITRNEQLELQYVINIRKL